MPDRSAALTRKATRLTVVWFIFLVGAGVAFAAHARVIALVLFILAVLSLLTWFFLIVSAYSRFRENRPS